MIWESTISYPFTTKDGKVKTKKESYVLENKESFSEVEQIMLENFDHINGLEIVAIKPSKVKEIVNHKHGDDELIYEAVVKSVFVDEDSGEERETKYKMILCEKSLAGAMAFVGEYLRMGYGDLDLVSLKKTSFVNILL